MNINEACQTLGVSRGMSLRDVKRTFRTLAKKYHPDVGGSEAIFKQVSAAYSFVQGWLSAGNSLPPERKTPEPEYNNVEVIPGRVRRYSPYQNHVYEKRRDGTFSVWVKQSDELPRPDSL